MNTIARLAILVAIGIATSTVFATVAAIAETF